MASTQKTTDVLISGAGPTGLMLAVVLARLGVDHILVDGKSGPTTESRALGVQSRTLEIYETARDRRRGARRHYPRHRLATCGGMIDLRAHHKWRLGGRNRSRAT